MRLALHFAVFMAFTVMALHAPASAAGPRDLAGTYSGDTVTLTLRALPNAGDYAGNVTLNGKTYTCLGRLDAAGRFQGTFEVDRQFFPITLEAAADGTFVLSSGKSRYTVKPGNAAKAAPALMQPGLRLSWNSGNSTREGCTLEPDPKGWILKNGKRYSIAGHVGHGQEGIRQLTVQQADGQGLIGEVRNFTINANLQGKTINTANYTVAVGNGTALEDYWVHPAVLAKLPEGREEDGQVTSRGKYVAPGGVEFDTIRIAKTDANGASSLTYDLATGVLLSLLRSDITPNLIISTPNGNASFNGTCHIERLTFVGARQIKFAWGGQVASPAWAQQGAQLELAGNYRADIAQTPGLPPLPPTPGFPVGTAFKFRGGTKQVALADFTTIRTIDRGGLQDRDTGVRCFGSHTYMTGLWASPKVLAALQPNQMLDEDRVTGYRTIFAGVRGNLAVISEVGPNETSETGYDVRSGQAVLFRNVLQLIPGTAQITEMQVQKQP